MLASPTQPCTEGWRAWSAWPGAHLLVRRAAGNDGIICRQIRAHVERYAVGGDAVLDAHAHLRGGQGKQLA